MVIAVKVLVVKIAKMRYTYPDIKLKGVGAMPKTIKEQDVIGKKFGRWTALEKAVNDRYHTFFICECECGTIREVDYRSLKNTTSKGCGCVHSTTTHSYCIGGNTSKEYRIWQGMKRRCYNLNEKSYMYYGGRGIAVCDRWLNSFENFLEDMGKCPKGLTIERVDNNGNYCKENCGWVSRQTQTRNRRVTVTMMFNGVLTVLKEVSDITGFNYYKLYHMKVRKKMEDSDILEACKHCKESQSGK